MCIEPGFYRDSDETATRDRMSLEDAVIHYDEKSNDYSLEFEEKLSFSSYLVPRDRMWCGQPRGEKPVKVLVFRGTFYGMRRKDNGEVILDITDDLPVEQRVPARTLLYHVPCELPHETDNDIPF